MSRNVIVFGLAFIVCAGMAGAQGTAPRQIYSPWQYNQDKGYHYRKFEYKTSPQDATYKHEYVIYHQADPKKQINNHWVYFYNPTTEKIWARYPTVNHPQYGKDAQAGREVWSVLPVAERKKDVHEIDQKKWPVPPVKFCPTVPQCKDNCNLASPPADLP